MAIKIRIGIAGYGKMGKIRRESIESSNQAELVSIFDISGQIVNEQGIRICKTFDELIDSGVDAIFIATYVKDAANYTIRALNAGKHVFCEKPPCINLDQMKEVIRVEKDQNRILKYGFNHRFHYSIMEAKRIIDSEEMGRILWMRGVYGKAGSIDFDKNWRNYKEFSGGGILMDQGIHMLDLFRYFSNCEQKIIKSHIVTSFWDINSEDNAFLILESSDGVTSTLHSSATQWRHKFLLEIALEKGYLTLDGILSSTRSYAPETIIIGRRDFEDINLAMGKPQEHKIFYENDNSWKYELEEFLNAINKKSKVTNGTIEDAFEVMKLIDAVYNG